MVHTGRNSGGFFNTGRLITWGAILVLAGAAVPSMKDGTLNRWTRGASGVATSAGKNRPVVAVRNATRVVSTRTRMLGIIAELKLWTAKYGVPRSDQLTDVIGRDTATDAWGRRIRYEPPTPTSEGWLRSRGPDSHNPDDDIYVPVSWEDIHRGL